MKALTVPSVGRLRQDGHDVLYVAEMEPGIGDDVVLERANKNPRAAGTRFYFKVLPPLF